MTVPNPDTINYWLTVYAIFLSIVEGARGTAKLADLWRNRHLRRVWGIKDGDHVIVICSELDEPASRQYVEPREFIYSLKYGDVDAYFEVLVTLLRLYPSIKLRVVSAGEIETTRLDLARHLIIIGGPDYNALTARVMEWAVTRFAYRSPDGDSPSRGHPEEIVLYDRLEDREYCHKNDTRDFGYFERIRNPNNPKSNILIFGGCHTIGVAGAVKAFSMAESEDGEIPSSVRENAARLSRKIKRVDGFAVLVEVERIGQTISVPLVNDDRISLKTTAERFVLRS